MKFGINFDAINYINSIPNKNTQGANRHAAQLINSKQMPTASHKTRQLQILKCHVTNDLRANVVSMKLKVFPMSALVLCSFLMPKARRAAATHHTAPPRDAPEQRSLRLV